MTGDTPADIECGRSIGAKAIVVSPAEVTPSSSSSSHNPYAAFLVAENTEQVLEMILNA